MAENKEMYLKSIWIYRYDAKSDFNGKVEIEGKDGEIKIVLNDSEVKAILAVCGESLVNQSMEAANRFREAILKIAGGKND